MSKVSVANAAGQFEQREAVQHRLARAESDSAEATPWWVRTEESVAALAVVAAKNPVADVSLWERAMLVLEESLGETCAFTKKTYRELYKDSSAQDIWNRSPNLHRKAAVPQEGLELKRARRIAHTKMILACNAYEGVVAEYEALGGNRNDSEPS
jgi:hypothetical protein